MRKILGLLPLCLLLLPAAPAAGQTASLVTDLNSTGSAFEVTPVEQLLAVGGKVFFTAYDPRTLTEVWVTDGTASGTEMLADTCPGECGSVTMLGEARGLAFWLAAGEYGPEAGQVLWRSDGTRAGTFALTDPALDVHRGLSTSRAFLGGNLFFTGCSAAQGCELWKSDGTVAGTKLVADLLPGAGDSRPASMAVAGGRLFFIATDPASSKRALWKSDGAAAGTSLLKTLDSGLEPQWLDPAGGKLFFQVRDPEAGVALWVSDGTPAGTLRVREFTSETPNYFGSLQTSPGRVYFLADDGTNGMEVWRSDGTPAGTVRLTDFEPEALADSRLAALGDRVVFTAYDASSGQTLWAAGSPAGAVRLCSDCSFEYTELARLGDGIVFSAQDPLHGREPWITDGTPQGTRMISDTCPGDCDGQSRGTWFYPAGDALFFLSEADSQIWRTDGTRAGTRRYTDLRSPSYGLHGLFLTAVGPRIFFNASDFNSEGLRYGETLWTSDGRPGGTRMVTDVYHDAPSSSPWDLVTFGDKVLFVACDGQELGLWQSAGTAATTQRIASPDGAASSCGGYTYPRGLAAIGGQVFYWRVRDTEGNPEQQLWRTDGTPAGTRLLASFPGGGLEPVLHELQGRAVFLLLSRPYSDVPPDRLEIWTSDGTPQGTGKAFDLPSEVVDIQTFQTVGAEIYFSVPLSGGGIQLWRSDGTAAGTRKILTGVIAIGDLWNPSPFVRSGAWVFFFSSSAEGYQLWKTDGTAAGTTAVRYVPGNYWIPPSNLTAWQGAVYFLGAVGSDELDNGGLWRSDGTAAGTVPVREAGRDLSELTPFAGQLFFSASGDGLGSELWRSDGTPAGTVRVRDIFPGPAGSRPSGLRAAGDRLFFSAHDGVHGAELWQSDGTEAGTRRVQDLAPGAASSAPQELTVAGSSLFFTADDGYTGRELWTLPLAAPAGCQPSPRQLCLGGGRFRVEARWRDFAGQAGQGTAVPLTADTGYFWFFGPDNVEVVIKVLDGRTENGHHWVFYGALSSVEYALTVTDTQTGASVRYFNPAGQTASVGDVTGFGRLGAFSSKRIEKTAPPALPALVAERFDPAAIAPCQAGPTRLCLNGGRFAVEASWKALGRTDDATAVPLTADTGYFWFFGPDNVEVVVKVLDGRGHNGRFWVFYGALSDVEYTLTVTDTQTGKVKTYTNPKGRFASVGDTGAF